MKRTNKQIIADLIQHIKLGKPILNKRRKPITDYTAYKYNLWLTKMDKWFDKPFEDITDADVDNFRTRLKEDKIRSGKIAKDGKTHLPYNDSTKQDLENKFLKTLLMYLNKPDLALFLSNYKEDVEIPALTKETVERIINRSVLRDKVIFAILFDGGFRAAEFLNIKFKDIKTDALKSDGYYKIRITKSKTLPRTVGLTLPLTTDIIKEWLRENKDKIGTSKPLIDLSYRHFNLTIRNSGLRIIKEKITPHQLRHSSATYYCHILSRYQLCKRYGWAMSSDMPQRYIDREGVEDEPINNKVVAHETLSLKEELNKLKEQLNQRNEQISKFNERITSIKKDVSREHEKSLKEIKGYVLGLLEKKLKT